jgi:hypothetical protein
MFSHVYVYGHFFAGVKWVTTEQLNLILLYTAMQYDQDEVSVFSFDMLLSSSFFQNSCGEYKAIVMSLTRKLSLKPCN